MVAIFDPPALDLKPSADSKDDESVEEAATTLRTYTKRDIIYVQSPEVLYALNSMVTSAFTYIRKPNEGYTIGGYPAFGNQHDTRYAFYYGKSTEVVTSVWSRILYCLVTSKCTRLRTFPYLLS